MRPAALQGVEVIDEVSHLDLRAVARRTDKAIMEAGSLIDELGAREVFSGSHARSVGVTFHGQSDVDVVPSVPGASGRRDDEVATVAQLIASVISRSGW
jgi:hypothetical protein